ncbi:MAG: hypothetical protein F6K63_16445 [Moorea sp. SIO1G6]|nr:hypothetical protein [Moorena sp. SIO1G6]
MASSVEQASSLFHFIQKLIRDTLIRDTLIAHTSYLIPHSLPDSRLPTPDSLKP